MKSDLKLMINKPIILFSLFRFLFGILMIPQVLHLVPQIHDLANSTIVFHYPYLNFVEAYSHELLDFLQYSSIFGAVLLALGIFPRLSAALFLISFGYLFLIDKSYYNNHYYLWCLVAFLFAILKTNQSINIFDVFRGDKEKILPPKVILAFCLLFCIVYFFGGIVKINSDWLQGYPMRLMTASRGISNPDFWGYFLSILGLLFDLFIPFLLWFKPKKWYVILPYFIFHVTNYFIFNIGEFPLVMMAAWPLFYAMDSFDKKSLLRDFFTIRHRDFAHLVLVFFFLIQLLLPLRSFIVPGNVAWHRQGYDFSWRMMLNNYEVSYFQFKVEMPELNDSYFVDFSKLVTYRQFYHAYHDPYMIHTMAQKLKLDAQRKYRTENIKVFCNSNVKLNQHDFKQLVHPEIDLGKQPYFYFSTNKFISSF